MKYFILGFMYKCTTVCAAISLLHTPADAINHVTESITVTNTSIISAYESADISANAYAFSDEESRVAYESQSASGNVISGPVAGEISADAEEAKSESINYAVAQVDRYVNVRAQAGTDSEIVGHIYNESVGEIEEYTETDDGLWLKIVSGNVEGYVKAEFFIYGDELAETIDNYVKKVAVVQCERLNVRAEAGLDGKKIGSAIEGEVYPVAEDEEIGFTENWRSLIGQAKEETGQDDALSEEVKDYQWVKIDFKNHQTGYVCLDYVIIRPDYATAVSMEEERAKEEAERKAAERKAAEARAAAEAAQRKAAQETAAASNTASVSYSSNTELRQSIVDYAKQYVGYKYVSGGKSLEGGTDCSGFTCFVLANFGYSVGRTPSSQYTSAGRSVSLQDAQPGDIVCFGSGSCTHVALYIGNNQIVHEANSQAGCIISDINFMNILGIKNVID